MNPSQVDTIARLFASRRFSRRQALASGSGLAALGLNGAAAQEATPSVATPSPEAETGKTSFLFVQVFGAGSLSPKSGADEMLTLKADHLTGQTIFFSDRPERIVGTVPTERFLGTGSAGNSATPEGGLDFAPTDPPNAALVFDSAAGDPEPGDAIILELIDPTYDRATGQATYTVKVLADETAVDFSLISEPVAAADAIRQFEGASLFIDDCANGTINCLEASSGGVVGSISPVGFCWNYTQACCQPCGDTDWNAQCTSTYHAGCTEYGDDTECNYNWNEQTFFCPS